MRTEAAAVPAAGETTWRPLAHVAVRDRGLRAQITMALREEGWAVVESPSGYHLLQMLAEPLFANELWLRPQLAVVDAFSPGCSGLTIAVGLRELGWAVPSVLVVHSPEQATRVADEPDRYVFVAQRDVALHTVLEVARHRVRKGVELESETAEDHGVDHDHNGEDEELTSHMSTGFPAGQRRAMA